jgi:hypothetical protein
MDTIQFPVSFDNTGFTKLQEGSFDYFRQLLTITLLTEPEIHPITPDFGVADPSFAIVDTGLFVLNAARFIPEVVITSVDKSVNPNNFSTSVSFSFALKG